jgi:Domain of unknown function (DUF3883)
VDPATVGRLHGPEHVRCLQWFERHIGEEVRFNQLEAGGIKLVTQFKGIFKPQWMPYVLSIRTTEQDRYADGKIIRQDDDSWRMSYAQEEDDRYDPRELFTNRAVAACIDDRIPIGILRKEHRGDPYEVVGLGLPVEWRDGFFTFVSYKPGALAGRTGAHAGRITDAVLRAAIETHAVNLVMSHYTELGYAVTDVGAIESYDVLAIQGAEELHIEVKGSTGTADAVELTANEVTHARAVIPTDLVVVDEIKWTRLDDGTIQTSGGRRRSWRNWQPAEKDLTASRYRYRLPE